MTSNWIAALKRALKPKEAVSECIADVRGGDNDETNRNTAPIQCPRTVSGGISHCSLLNHHLQ